MINHVFKLLWKRKRKNLFIILLLMVSFLALSFFVVMNFRKALNFATKFNYSLDHSIVISFHKSIDDQSLTIKEQLLKLPSVKGISRIESPPFDSYTRIENFSYKNTKNKVGIMAVDDNFQKLLKLKMLKGNWYTQANESSALIPVVISKDLVQLFFKGEDPIGKKLRLTETDEHVMVIGIVDNYWYNDRDLSLKPAYLYWPVARTKKHSLSKYLFVQLNPKSSSAKFHKQSAEIFSNKTLHGITISAPDDLVTKKALAFKKEYIIYTVLILVAFFLLLNLFLGVSGVFSYTIAQREPEIGLRMAMGAPASFILKQFVGEATVLTTFAIVPGVLIALQFLITDYFNTGLSLPEGIMVLMASAAFMYLLVLTCVIYPAIKASKIRPATALREE